MSVKKLFSRRVLKEVVDPWNIANAVYNDSAGSNKVILIEPVVIRAVTNVEKLPFGSYVKVTGTTYTLDLLDKAHSTTRTYKTGDLVTTGGNIYIATRDNLLGAFTTDDWEYAAPKQIGPVTIVAGSVVCLGRFHNTASAAGFLVDDDSEVLKQG